MENQEKKSTEPDVLRIKRGNLETKNGPKRQTSFSQRSARSHNIMQQADNGDPESKNFPAASRDDGHKFSPESGSYLLEIKNSKKDTSEYIVAHEEPHKPNDIQDVSEDIGSDVKSTSSDSYFLENHELQFSVPDKIGVTPHFCKSESSQTFMHFSTRLSKRGGKKSSTSPKESVEENGEYWRRNVHSILEQEITLSQRQWFRSREARSRTNFWLVILGLTLTFITAVLIVILWEYLHNI